MEVRFRRGAEKDAVQSADVSLFEQFQFEPLQLIEIGLVGGSAENASPMLGMHPCGHRSEGEDTLDADLLGECDKLFAERIAADRRLGLAEKHDEIVLLFGIGPDEKAVAWPAGGFDQAFFYFDM